MVYDMMEWYERTNVVNDEPDRNIPLPSIPFFNFSILPPVPTSYSRSYAWWLGPCRWLLVGNWSYELSECDCGLGVDVIVCAEPQPGVSPRCFSFPRCPYVSTRHATMPSTRSGRSTSVKSKAQAPAKKAPTKKTAVKKAPAKKSKSPAPPKKKAVAKAKSKSPVRKKAPRRKTPPPAKKTKAVTVEPTTVPHPGEETPVFKVNEILDTRKKGRVVHYLVSWVGYPPEDNTWETASDLKMDGHAAAINKFTAARKKSEKATKEAAAADATQEQSSSENEEVPALTQQTPDANVDSVNSVGSFMFYWTVMVCTIVTYTMIQILLNGTGDLISFHPSERDHNKWAAFLSQASPWVAILPPFISVVVLISHPGSTAPFPKYLSVALVWISTHNFLEHFAEMELQGENIKDSVTILLALTSIIAYTFLANGFAGPRGDNRHPAPGHMLWGAVWFFLWTWEFVNRVDKHMFHKSIEGGIKTFPQDVWNTGDYTTQATILLKIAELVALYYAVYKASTCIGHGCGLYSSAAVPQHIGVVAMLFIVFANMFPIIFHETEHAWFMTYVPKVLSWLGGALLTTVGLWDADTFHQ
jgi:hypothetical protein